MAYFVENVEVVLDVLKGAVLRELVQERLDLLFGGGHSWFDRLHVTGELASGRPYSTSVLGCMVPLFEKIAKRAAATVALVRRQRRTAFDGLNTVW